MFGVLAVDLHTHHSPHNSHAKIRCTLTHMVPDPYGYIIVTSSLFPTETRQAVSKLLLFTAEPKSAEIRKMSQKAVTKLFELNPATFTLMLRSVPKAQQETASRQVRQQSRTATSPGLVHPWERDGSRVHDVLSNRPWPLAKNGGGFLLGFSDLHIHVYR